MSNDWPGFGRDVPDAAWRPGREAPTATRLVRFISATSAADLEALQRHAQLDPAWFWGAAADDLGLSWQRRPSGVLDISRGVEWARWWTGAAFNYAAAAVSRFCVFWIRKTIRNVAIVVSVLVISCHVSLKPNSGPVTAHDDHQSGQAEGRWAASDERYLLGHAREDPIHRTPHAWKACLPRNVGRLSPENWCNSGLAEN